ncbi:hypothetical protein HF313_22825 [Massilia atriviolacea]|uniref:Uncharacterized protein n=1 Tax=Massilia atriviolacea TaxID=2495579 RepID=A0A430HCI1_9BURK|nr:hypothetical protein EJB06_30370 [Massilia atriviolacea]
MLFDTGYERSCWPEHVYIWSYLVVRFMIKNKRQEIEKILDFTCVGDHPRCQAVIRKGARDTIRNSPAG